MKEESFRYGKNQRGFGVATLPHDMARSPVFVTLNAGLLYRAEPYRLNVQVTRALAKLGYIGIRIDLSGKGDTPVRPGLSNRESVASDWRDIKSAVDKRFGKRPVIIMGLCSGADNAIKLAAEFEDIVGVVLLDPISPRDADFRRRALRNKLSNPYTWLRLPVILLNRLKRMLGKKAEDPDNMGWRDEPTPDDLNACLNNLVQRNGRCLAFFTSHAHHHYNEQGQFGRVMSHIEGLDRILEEFHWPGVRHLYPVQAHRDRLVKEIEQWGRKNISLFSADKS